MFPALAKGVLLGLGAAAPIGPVNVEIARRTLRHGFRAGFFLGVGAVTVDVSYAILVSFSIRPVLDRAWLLNGLTWAGAALLTWLGWLCLRDFRSNLAPVAEAPVGALAVPPALGGYVAGLLMTSLNPITLVFWFTGVPAQAAGLGNPARELPFLAGGVFMGALSWVIFFAGITATAGALSKRRMMSLANLLGGLTLLGFAGVSIWHWMAKAL